MNIFVIYVSINRFSELQLIINHIHALIVKHNVGISLLSSANQTIKRLCNFHLIKGYQITTRVAATVLASVSFQLRYFRTETYKDIYFLKSPEAVCNLSLQA